MDVLIQIQNFVSVLLRITFELLRLAQKHHRLALHLNTRSKKFREHHSSK